MLDASVLLTILIREPESGKFARAIESAEVARWSPAGYLEAAVLVDRNGDEVWRAMVDDFVGELGERIWLRRRGRSGGF